MSAGDPMSDALASLDGARIPGGCAACDAYRTVRLVSDGVTAITVHHDDWCPWWQERQTKRGPGS